MTRVEDRLRTAAMRIERLSVAPVDVANERFWLRLTRPLFRWAGWRPELRTARLQVLLSALHEARPDGEMRLDLQAALTGALDELEGNLDIAERAAVIDGIASHGPLAGWLTRLHEVMSRAAWSVADPHDNAKRSLALAPFTEWAVTPLVVRPPSKGEEGSAPDAGEGSNHGDAPNEADAASAQSPRLVELELAAVDRVLDAACAETHFLGRRRRLFEAARKLLLDAAAAVPVDPNAVHLRARHIADEMVLVNRLQAAGVEPEVGLAHQALTSLGRGERQKLYATLRASALVAASAGDLPTVARSMKALSLLHRDRAGHAEDGNRSATEILGEEAVHTIRDAYESARREAAFRRLAQADAVGDEPEQRDRTELWDQYLREEPVLATLSAAVSVDGCFEVGGTLSPVRVEEVSRRVRVVSHPTQDLVVVPSRDVGDLTGAVIDDPRGVILALAEGRLLARKFLHVEETRVARTRLVREARIYVLDGSDSMLEGGSGRRAGARARMRDAILLAELATLFRRATERTATTRTVLFYRYFTKLLGDVHRVESPKEALGAMADVVATPRHGGTDIQAALLASFEQIRQARATDPDLARAQIVLVTDGDAAVDEVAVRAAREREGDFPIGVSVIALGQENPVLRRLAAAQRARGEPTFYHFISDEDLAAVVEGRRAAGARIHAPEPHDGDPADAAPESFGELAGELGSLVEEIDALARKRTSGAEGAAATEMGTPDGSALAEVGLGGSETEGQRAQREARERDERALATRFDAWFPPLGIAVAGAFGRSGAPDEDAAWAADVEAVLVVLTSLADILPDLGGTALERRADAVDLLERLLPDARLSPARYRMVASARPPAIDAALSAVRASVLGGAGVSRTSRSPSR